MFIRQIVLAAALTILSLSPAYAASYSIDPSASEVSFQIAHPVGFNSGFLSDMSGTIEVDADKVKSVRLDVKTNSIDTLNEKRDKAVRSSKLLDAENFPVMSINSTSVSDKTIKADLVYKGKSYPVTLDYIYLGRAGGKEPVLRLHGKVNREDIGMVDKTNPENGSIGKEIELFILLRGKQ